MATGKLHWDEENSVAANARSILPGLVAGYFEEVRGFLAKKHKPKELHRMRLASKRLRYTLELFRGCYGPGLEERLDALKDVQDALGDVNDAVAAEGLLDPRTVQKVRRFLRARAEEKAQEFRLHWTETFDAPEREKWWTGYLANSRLPRRKKAKVKTAGAAG